VVWVTADCCSLVSEVCQERERERERVKVGILASYQYQCESSARDLLPDWLSAKIHGGASFGNNPACWISSCSDLEN
jgi:hypothetical protein